MPWATILSYAAGITTAISLAAFIAGLYMSFLSRTRETSVLNAIKGEGIVNAESAVEMFKTLTTDEARLQFFEKFTPYEKTRAEGVLEKVKANVDLEKFSSTSQAHLQRRLNWAALFLIVLAFICVGLSKLPYVQHVGEDRGGRARAEANEGWDFEVGHDKPVNYTKAMELYKKAAADGDATACWNIARLYEFGFGVPKDFDKAKYYYEEATAAGEPRGKLYEDNIGKNQPYVDTK